MKEGKPLAKDLCLVVRLDPQPLSCVERPETFLQFTQYFLFHGINFLQNRAIFQARDRTESYTIVLTQNFLSEMLGFAARRFL